MFEGEEVQVTRGEIPARVLAHMNSGGLVYAANSSFEQAILENVYAITDVELRCTMAIANYNALPGSLEAIAKVLGVAEKDVEGNKVMKKWCKTPSANIPIEARDRIMDYCKVDVIVEQAIHEKLGDLPPVELAIWKLDQKMNRRGLTVDLTLAHLITNKVKEQQALLSDKVSGLTDGVVTKPTQGKRIIDWLATKGIVAADMTADTVKGLLTTDLPDDAREVLLCRQRGSLAAIGKYKRAIDMACHDSTVKGNLRYHGATTGRWAGMGLQPQNLPRGNVSDTDTLADMILRQDWVSVENMAGNVFDAAKSAVRPLITASEGSKLVVADYSSIEARVLAWFAGQEDLVYQFEEGEDIYCSFASEIFGERVTKADKLKRMVGKVGILGLGYQMGANKFKDTLKAWAGMDVKPSFAQRVVDSYRTTYASIPQLWYKLGEDAVEAVLTGQSGNFRMVGRNLLYTLPSGRDITYYRAGVGENQWGKPSLHYFRPLGKQMVKTSSYGGKLTENICQSISRDIMASSMLKIDQAGVRLLATVHDEIIAEAPETEAEKTLEIVEDYMTREKPWCKGAPLATEGFVSKRFKK